MLFLDAPEIVVFVFRKNDDRITSGESPYRFADLYHSANRTPVGTADVSWSYVLMNAGLSPDVFSLEVWSISLNYNQPRI